MRTLDEDGCARNCETDEAKTKEVRSEFGTYEAKLNYQHCQKRKTRNNQTILEDRRTTGRRRRRSSNNIIQTSDLH